GPRCAPPASLRCSLCAPFSGRPRPSVGAWLLSCHNLAVATLYIQAVCVYHTYCMHVKSGGRTTGGQEAGATGPAYGAQARTLKAEQAEATRAALIEIG